MNVLTRLALMFGFGVAATLASAVPAQAGDWGVSVNGGGWNNGWSVNYRDRDRHHGYGNNGYGYGYGYGSGYRPAPVYYVPYRPAYHRNDRYARYNYRSYDRRAPWCNSHRAYHRHDHNSYNNSYNNNYRDDYDDGYGDGRNQRYDYGSADYYDRIDEMSYDTSIYYGRRW